jgi:methionyl-tRNA formyltransferase
MRHKKTLAIVTSEKSWFVPYAEKFKQKLTKIGYSAKLYHDYKNIDNFPYIVFIISYFKIIPKEFLKKHESNVVIHESNLPQGKGWAPLFWQILEGKNVIPIVMFEVTENVDAGDIYLKNTIVLRGDELYDEIREIQAKKTMEMCCTFINNYESLIPTKQTGKETFYKKRTPADSELDVTKTIGEQFNKLRIVDNKSFPAFFFYRGRKYVLEIRKE